MRHRSTTLAHWATLLALIAALAGCKSTPEPKPLPSNATPEGALLLHGTVRRGELDCPRGDCIHWYRAELDEKGTLFVSASDITEGAALPSGYSVTLSESAASSLATQASQGRSSVDLERTVGSGRYLIAIRSDQPGQPFVYSIRADFVAAPPPPPPPPPEPPKPRFENKSATILEMEGWGQDVKAVLFDAGSRHGMEPGFDGALMDRGKEIGRLKIEQVYEDGSRAQVEGSLSQPVGPDTVVEIYVPIEP